MNNLTAERLENDIDHILTNFNFHRVHHVMVALNWTYFDRPEVPTISRLRITALHCLDSALDQFLEKGYDTYCCTGGFEATCSKEGLRLLFVVEEADTWNSHLALEDK